MSRNLADRAAELGSALRPRSAPAGGHLAICPHCWNVNGAAERLCARCGADMTLALQESGGFRRTAAVQSPVPVRAGRRLTPAQRWLIFAFALLLAAASLLGALRPDAPRYAPTPPARGGE